MPPVPNSSGGDFTIRSLSELSGTQTKHWPLDGLGSVINKKNGDNNSTSEEKADWCCFTDNTKTKAGWRGAALPRALFKGTNNEATRTTLKAAHSQSARECVQARQGEWKVVLFGVCVCVCARWKGGFVLAIDCGPVRSNVSGLTQTNTDVEAVKKKKRLTWCFWCFPEVDREMPLQRIVGFAIVSDGNNDETNASAQKMPIWYRTLNKERWPPHIMDFLKKDHVGISLKNVGPCKILQLYSKYFLSWLMIDDSFLNGPLS